MHKMQNMWVSNYPFFRWASARQSNWIQLLFATRQQLRRPALSSISTILRPSRHSLDGSGGGARRFLLSAKRLTTLVARKGCHMTTATGIPFNITARRQKWDTGTYAKARCGNVLIPRAHNCLLCTAHKGTSVGQTTLSGDIKGPNFANGVSKRLQS